MLEKRPRSFFKLMIGYIYPFFIKQLLHPESAVNLTGCRNLLTAIFKNLKIAPEFLVNLSEKSSAKFCNFVFKIYWPP